MSVNALLWLLAVAAGVSVANLYYSQPLLAMLAEAFHATPREAGLVPTFTQIGYAAGMLLLVPLGDSAERRKLIAASAAASTLSVLAVAAAPSFPLVVAASCILGLATAVPQLAVPYAAALVPRDRRGRALGRVMSGLLAGVLLSRAASGFVGAHLGWRATYLLAAALMAPLTALLFTALPRQEPEQSITYAELLRSIPALVRREPLLRRHALLGALSFGAFSTFWTSLVFLLSAPPHNLGAQAAGLFGIVGMAGVLIAPVAGRAADRYGARVVNGAALFCMLLGWIILALWARSLAGIGIGVVLLDLGAQGNHLSNQTRVLGLSPQMRNRINTVYMVSYFIGGAVGSMLGPAGFGAFGWAGVSAAGIGLSLLALAAFFGVGREAAVRADALALSAR